MRKIAVYTCITGNYDDVIELNNKEKNIDYYLFTNNENIKSNTWKVIYIKDDKLDNQRLSRKIKMLSHPILEDNYDILVWQDATVIWKKSIKEFVEKYLKNNSFAAFKHSCRNCIYEEATECIKLGKDEKNKILKHISFLEKENYPKNNGLCEMTVFIRKTNNKELKKIMNDWYEMICKYSKRDQLSFMYCVWKNKFKFDLINLNVWNNSWFMTKKHNRNKKPMSARIYYGDEKNFDVKRLEFVKYKIKDDIYSFTTKVLEDTDTIEIVLSNIPVVEYSNLSIENLQYDNLYAYNTINYEDNTIFYSEAGIIQILGNFKKNDSYTLNINLRVLSEEEKIKLIEDLSIKNILLDKENSELTYRLEKIENSKIWKIVRKIKGRK